jgi:hypothetical protein
MTRSKIDRELAEGLRAMTAEDRGVDYLDRNHRDHAAAIAMRVLYILAIRWKTERDCRLIRDPNDPQLVFNISDQYVRRVHEAIAELPPPSQSDVMAEHYVTTLLSEFKPDRARLIAHKIYHWLAWPPYPVIR